MTQVSQTIGKPSPQWHREYGHLQEACAEQGCEQPAFPLAQDYSKTQWKRSIFARKDKCCGLADPGLQGLPMPDATWST
jgi:hypothetical protein